MTREHTPGELIGRSVRRVEDPVLEEIEPGHYVRCHRADELHLRGVGEG